MVMQRVPVMIIEDAARVAPLDDLRPSFLVRSGALSMAERLCLDDRVALLGACVGSQRAALTHAAAGLAGQGSLLQEVSPGAARVLLLNGRCPLLPQAVLDWAQRLGSAGSNDSSLVEDGAVVAAWARPTPEALAQLCAGGALGEAIDVRTVHAGRLLIARPWHVRSSRDACLAHDQRALSATLPPASVPAGVVRIGTHAVLAAPSAAILPGSVLDTTAGPITVAEHALVRPGAILIGPCHVGPHSTVLERATIRAGTAIGPWCKVNGEVGGTIFQGFANKAHDGYLGDSFVGEWVNLGAGTTNSNLLNTYGEVLARATPTGRHERTGEQFLGAIIGDHVKTAICTRIMTGSVLHLGGMFATTAPVSGCTPPFAWATDEGVKSYRADKFLEVMRAAMARRSITPPQAYVDAVRTLAEAASAQRAASTEAPR